LIAMPNHGQVFDLDGEGKAIAFETDIARFVILSDRGERRIPFWSAIQLHTTRFFVATLLRMTVQTKLESKCDCPNGEGMVDDLAGSSLVASWPAKRRVGVSLESGQNPWKT
jgi:hypothetical protein